MTAKDVYVAVDITDIYSNPLPVYPTSEVGWHELYKPTSFYYDIGYVKVRVLPN